MGLGIEARATLAGRLLMSLDIPSDSELERLWLDEAERRLQDYRQGVVRGIPTDDVFRRALAELK
ncbi:MAG TPA: addiction module protein [Desulfuromonadaceae bacterium]